MSNVVDSVSRKNAIDDIRIPEKTPDNLAKAVELCYLDIGSCKKCPLFQPHHDKVCLELCDEWMTDELHRRVQAALGELPDKGPARRKYAKEAARIGLECHFDGLYLDFKKVMEEQ